MTSTEGIYRNGKIELSQLPTNINDKTRVIVTFIESNDIELSAYGIDRLQAESLRANLGSFADDWNSPEMSIYDNYDSIMTVTS
ncbi:hypothetical protein [Aliterella atlantica]|nr:hypothetical protein [Aliterella atlantica]